MWNVYLPVDKMCGILHNRFMRSREKGSIMQKLSVNPNTAWFSVFFIYTDKPTFTHEVRGHSADSLHRAIAKLENNSNVTILSATWGTADDIFGESAEWVY